MLVSHVFAETGIVRPILELSPTPSSPPRARDPFDPQRRGAPVPHGKRGPVLTRKERQERQRRLDEQASRRDRAETRRFWRLVDSLSDIHNITARSQPFGWPLEGNLTARFANLALYLFPLSDAPARIPGSVRNVRPADTFNAVDPVIQDPPIAPNATNATIDAQARVQAVRGAGWPAVDGTTQATTLAAQEPVNAAVTATARAPGGAFNATRLADRIVASLIKQRCAVAMQLEFLARGLSWGPAQDSFAQLASRRCKVTFDTDMRKVQRATIVRDDQFALEIELSLRDDMLMRLDPLKSGRVSRNAGTSPTDGFGFREHPDSPTHWPDVRAAQRRIKFPGGAAQPAHLRTAYECLAEKLAEFLQSPCGALVREYHALRCESKETLLEKIGSTMCDLVFQATGAGLVESLFGQLLSMTIKMYNGEPMTREEIVRGIELMTMHRNAHNVVELGEKKMLWTGDGLREIHEGTEKAYLSQGTSTPARPRMPDLPVKHTAQGWKITEIPEEYAVRDADVIEQLGPEKIRQTSARSGFIKLGDKAYEVGLDDRSTRWRIVPPDGKAGIAIPVEFNGRKHRWEAIRLIGAGDPPPLAERYAARDAELRTGAEQDVYVDAHEETYDASALPEHAEIKPLETLIEQYVTDRTLTPHRAGVLRQYIEARRWRDLMQAYGEATRKLVDSDPEASAEYLHGLLRGDVARIRGYRRDLSVDQLAAFALNARLTPFEAGACAMEMAERMVRSQAHRAAERMMRSGQRAWTGELGWERIAIPGLAAHASFEDMISHFLYGRMTDTQRGALVPRIGQLAQRLSAQANGIARRIETLQESMIPGEADALRTGYEQYREIVIEVESGTRTVVIDSNTEIEGLLNAAQSYADEPAMLGAIDHWITDHRKELDVLEAEFADAVEDLRNGHEMFLAGMNEATHIELPPTAHGSTVEMAALFLGEKLTLKERGAVYARFRELDALDRIDAVIEDRRANGFSNEIRRGYEHPLDVQVEGLSAHMTLDDIAARLEREPLTPAQAGRLSRIADDLVADAREARVDAFRHRIVTGPEFDAYLAGYFDARGGARPDLGAASPETLVELFRADGGSARLRGQIAFHITRAEVEQLQRDEVLLQLMFAGVRPQRRIPFSQFELPRMFNGLLDGCCYSLVAVMSVAMHRGEAAVETFIARVRRLQPEAVVKSPEALATLGDERREFYAAFASIAVRQPRSPGALVGREILPLQEGVDWEQIRGIVDEAMDDLMLDIERHEEQAAERVKAGETRADVASDQAEIQALNERSATSYLIETDRHALLVRVEYAPRSPFRVAVRFYEPNYGILTFNSLEAFDDMLHRAFGSGFYIRSVLGGSRHVNVYAIDPRKLGALRIRGDLFVKDLVETEPFVQKARRTDAGSSGDSERESELAPDRKAKVDTQDPVAGPSGWVPGPGPKQQAGERKDMDIDADELDETGGDNVGEGVGEGESVRAGADDGDGVRESIDGSVDESVRDARDTRTVPRARDAAPAADAR